MNICSDGHDEIVYDGRNGPLCLAQETIKELEDRLDNAKDNIKSLERELTDTK
jgi:hypothetical protein